MSEYWITDIGSRNARLREISPVYPEIYEKLGYSPAGDKEVTLSTWAPFEHEGTQYERHCVEVGIISETCSIPQVYDRIHYLAYQIRTMAKPYLENKEHPELNILCDRQPKTS